LLFDSSFLQLLCKTLAAKIYMSSQKHSSAMLYPIRTRLAHYIISQTEAMGSLAIILNTNETAQYLGITSRHMRRVLANLESEGLIHRCGYKITIKDINKIREWSSVY
jgi:CRP-like cAMP-binding protein